MTMTKRRSEQEFTQELTNLLSTQGISNLTIADIAKYLQCSKRRLYQIAATKEELFLGVCQAVFKATIDKGYAAAKKESSAAKAIPAYMRAALNASGLSKAALIDLDASAAGRAVFDAYQEARIRGLERMIEEGVRQGVLVPHNPRLVSEAILGAAIRLRNQQFLTETGLKIGDAFNAFYEIILNGLLKHSPSDQPN